MTPSPDGAAPSGARPPAARAPTARLTITGLATALVGLALLAYLLRQTGVAPILEGGRPVGWGFLVIVALGLFRLLTRALAWRRCLESPADLPIVEAFAATLSGDALGNVIPLGPLASEPAKVAFVRQRLGAGAAASALAVENFLYTLTVALVAALGLLALLFAFRLPEPLRSVMVVSLAAAVGLLAASFWLVGRRLAVLGPALERLTAGRAARLTARVRWLEARTYELYERRRGRLLPVLLWQAIFHAAGVVEIYVTLWLLTGTGPTLLTSFLLESVNRVITAVFKIVPLRLGVDEAGTALFTNVLGLGTTIGVTLALVRKARVIVLVTSGLVLLVRRGLSLRRILTDETLTDSRPS